MSEENSSGARKKVYSSAAGSEELNEPEESNKEVIADSLKSFFLPGEIPPSPPKFISLEELMKAANGMKNMALAHEIAVNKDFKLEKFEAPENSLEKIVKETMHRAFWDVLEEELAQSPPAYTRALVLLNDVKTGLLQLLLPQHTKIRQQISEILDVDLIKQQAQEGTLDFQQYAQYVISVMGKLCAPARDEKIAELSQTINVTDVFKGILETIDLMKIDMANFTINLMRPQIVASSVEYEKQKFADYLKIQTDGLSITKQWLERHLEAAKELNNLSKNIDDVINDAYLELIEWNFKEMPFPETLVMDEARIRDLSNEFKFMTLVGAVLLTTFSRSGKELHSITQLKEELKNTIVTLLREAEFQNASAIRHLLLGIGKKLEADLIEATKRYGVGANEINASNLDSALAEIVEEDNKIVKLIKQRIKEFLLTAIASQTAERMKIPPGFSILQNELTELAGSFLRLALHNRAVFGEYYSAIIEDCLRQQHRMQLNP